MDEGNPSATKTTLIVARGCNTARLSDTFVHLRRPRVQHGTLGRHLRAFPSPEGTAQHAWATLRTFPPPKGARQNDVRMKETLRQRNPHLSSPERARPHAWATLSYIFVARGCSTARLSDTSARFRRPKVLGKRRKVESDKKRRSLPKTRETSVGCPKPGSNRHVFKGHWILSPTRLPIPPFGHIHVDFPLDGNFALPLHFRFKGLQSY